LGLNYIIMKSLKYLDYLNEVDFNILSTEFSISNIENKILSYSFLSNNNVSYSVYFQITTENDEKLSNGKKLSDYTDINNIPTIFFSLTENGFGEKFDELVDKNEFLEVMGKVVFIILEYIKKKKLNIYSIGEVDDKKIKFYNNYRKYFKDFIILTGKSKNYLNDKGDKKNAYYLVKNDISIPEKLRIDKDTYLKLK